MHERVLWVSRVCSGKLESGDWQETQASKWKYVKLRQRGEQRWTLPPSMGSGIESGKNWRDVLDESPAYMPYPVVGLA